MQVCKDKRSKLDPSGKRGIFVGYSETSKAYEIYVSGFKKIEISGDVTFDEDAAFYKSKKNPSEEIQDEEPKAPRGLEPEAEEVVPEDHDKLEPQRPEDPPKEVTLGKRRSAWARELMQEAEKCGAPNRTFRESKKPKTYSNYVALLSNIIDAKPTNYEEAIKKQVWLDATVEEYDSIIKNEVWDVMLNQRDPRSPSQLGEKERPTNPMNHHYHCQNAWTSDKPHPPQM